MTDLALLILRLVTGSLLAAHGAQKLFGWFGGHGLAGTAGWLESLGFRPGRLWALLAGGCEFLGGLFLALGLFSPVGSLLIAAAMLTAIAKAHWPRLWVTQGGFELPLTNLAVAAAVGIAGPGAYALDALWSSALSPELAQWGLLLVLVGWVLALLASSRRPVQPA
ncbi:DoxX family protein [Calidithermus roseus]|uniref:Putative oxidoreductase MhqP n=1 Tax=Calidithermus roseus TaxID=1644118 RepID=A0A399EWH4_9DEIN|nr:DoxX family protein [Calidithermus roseus]RIH87985.1 putative oxidoreductase MhqP [Calidithermus roseus]